MLWARSDNSADRARASVTKLCAKAKQELDAERVQVVTGLDELAASATFLVEAVVEDHGSKASLLSDLAGHGDDQAVIATTTSSLSISELAHASSRPEQFVG